MINHTISDKIQVLKTSQKARSRISIGMQTNIQSQLVDLKDYQTIKVIKSGGFGTVYLVERKKDGRRFAAKVNLPKYGRESLESKFLSREICILMRVEAPTIVNFYGFSREDFEKQSNVTILMEYYENESLTKLIEEKRLNPNKFDNTTIQIILCGIAHGMMTLHSRRVIHRDLKPDNVLLDQNYHPYITDFGLSKFLDPTNSKSQSMECCGTAAYMSPELIENAHYTMKSDVYSFGILMFEVLTGELAFAEYRRKKNSNPFQIPNRVSKGERPVFRVPIKPSFQKLIQQCWSHDPKERPTFRELFLKLSLSLEDDDEAIESSLQELISNENENEFEYLLDNVDTDRLFDYVFHITSEQTKKEKELQQLVDEQAKRIQQLEERHQREIEMLHSKLNQITSQFVQMASSEIKDESSRRAESDNPLEGLTIDQMREKIIQEKLTEITFPSSVTLIRHNAFSSCTSLQSITIPSTVTSIGNDAFSDCSSLTQITIPSSVTSIGDYAFSYCSSLQQITIPSSVTSIGESAFFLCSSLTTISIPSSVTTIGNCAFSGCYKLNSTIKDKLTRRFGESIFG